MDGTDAGPHNSQSLVGDSERLLVFGTQVRVEDSSNDGRALIDDPGFSSVYGLLYLFWDINLHRSNKNRRFLGQIVDDPGMEPRQQMNTARK